MGKLLEFFNELEPKSDKGTSHSYIEYFYDEEFSNKKESPIKLLEVGIRQGYSHFLWKKFFTNSEIWGVDNGESGFEFMELLNKNGIKWMIEDGYSKDFLNEFDNNYFDYIIDDASHTIESQLLGIKLFLPKLKSGGKLIIEDIQGSFFLPRIESVLKANSEIESYKIFNLSHIKPRIDDILIEIIKK